jgi:hypothetical protein
MSPPGRPLSVVLWLFGTAIVGAYQSTAPRFAPAKKSRVTSSSARQYRRV